MVFALCLTLINVANETEFWNGIGNLEIHKHIITSLAMKSIVYIHTNKNILLSTKTVQIVFFTIFYHCRAFFFGIFGCFLSSLLFTHLWKILPLYIICTVSKNDYSKTNKVLTIMDRKSSNFENVNYNYLQLRRYMYHFFPWQGMRFYQI